MEKERRRSSRRKSFIDLGTAHPIATPIRNIRPAKCKIIDISSIGVSFCSDYYLAEKQLVRVAIKQNNDLYCVKWIKEVNDPNNGKFRYGLELLRWDYENHASG